MRILADRISMRLSGSLRGLAVLVVACCLFASHAAGKSLIVNTGYELHAALASPDISLVYVASNVSIRHCLWQQ
jgi:hypothetical protein